METTTPARESIHPEVINLIGPPITPSILFVDDDNLILRAFARDLGRSHFDLSVARSGSEGLAAIAEKNFSVIISDFQMPGMDGITFLDEVRKQSPCSVRILVSGRADFEMAIDVINRVGLFSFIPKPWEPHDMRDTILRAVEHFAITEENKRLSSLLSVKCDELSGMTLALEDEVQKRTTSLLLGLVNALDLRDTETQWHSRRVAVYCRRLAEEIDISGDELLTIERGALLHDVGKIGVSDTILLKPGKLTDEEWGEMRRHSEYGYRILEGIDFLGSARQLVWEHHERWDGKGYPRQVSGNEVYIGARIFGVIDTYDAMTSDRPYRKALSHEIACEEINKMSGSQFDPSIVKAWNKIDKNEIAKLRKSAHIPGAGLD